MDQERLFLHSASTGNDSELVKLLNHGIDIHCKDDLGNNALVLAAKHGHATTVERLLEAGLDLYITNASGHIPLIVAAMECHEEVVRAILIHSKRVSSRTKPSIVALMAANALEMKGCQEVANLLRTHPG